LQDCDGYAEAGGLGEAGQVGGGFADRGGGLISEPGHDDARVTAGRVAADSAQAAVEGDQDPAGRCRCGDDFGVGRSGQALGGDGVDVVPGGFQNGGGRGGQVPRSRISRRLPFRFLPSPFH
jgi:hypothetical protein